MNLQENQEKNKIEDIENPKEESFNPELVNEANKKALVLSNGQCGVCQRKGVPIFLVRKSIIPIKFRKDINWSQGMVSLGDREPEEKLLEYQYVYRTLREGYVYILCNPTGNQDDNKLEIMVYEVTYSGAMRLREFRDVKGSRPKEIPLNCIEDNHNVKGMFITIDNRVYDKAWVAYSSIRWKLATVKHYRENKDERLQRFSEVDLTKRKASELSTQERGFAFNDFVSKQRHLLEMECDDTSVLDYFDEKGRKVPEKKKSPLKGKTDKPKTFSDSVRQGIFNEKGFSLKKFINLSAEAIAAAFKEKFFTASHFNSLSSKEADKAITKTVSAYESDYNYSTEISALVLEDSMGLAEELSIQRRQKLAPVVEGFMNQTTPKGDQQKEAKQFDKLVRSSTHDLIYDSERKATQNPIAAAMQAKYGRDKLAEFFQKEKTSIKSHPIRYFEPEIAYARRQYQQIEQYKELIRSPVAKSDVNESYLFLFYISANNYDSSIKEDEIDRIIDESKRLRHSTYINHNNYLNYYVTDRKKMSELNEIDKIQVFDVIGEELLATQLGVEPESTFWNKKVDNWNYLYCRRLSLYGFETNLLSQKGLGEYKEYELTAEQQQQLLALYKTNNKTRMSNYIDSVKVVHFYNLEKAKESYADKLLNGDWDKRKKRLNQPSLDNFEALEKTGKESLTEFVSNASKDYYNYLMWLFGENLTHFQLDNQDEKDKQDDKAKNSTVTLPNRFNMLPFWRIEFEPDLSDRHISFFYTFLLIIDSASLGTMTLPEHSAFWGMLLNNEESIYFYLLAEKPLKSEETPEDKLTVSLIQCLHMLETHAQPTLMTAISSKGVIFNTTKTILSIKIEENVDVARRLIEHIVTSSVDGANRAMQNNIKINQIKMQDHYIDTINLFKVRGPEVIRQYKVKMTIKGLNQYLKKNHQMMPLFSSKQMTTNKGNIVNLIQSQNKDRWSIPLKGKNKNFGKEVVEINMLMAFEDMNRVNEFEKGFTKNGGFSQKVLKNIAPNVIEVNGITLDADEVKYLSDVIPRQKQYVEVFDTSKSLVLSGISLYFQYENITGLNKQIDNIKDPHLRTVMKFRIYTSYAIMGVTTIEVLLHGTKLFKLLLAKTPSLFLQRTSRMAMFKGTLGVLNKAAGVLNVIDSAIGVYQAFKSCGEGNTGSTALMITSILTLICSVVGWLNLIPGYGQIFFAIISIGALIAGMILYDNGDDWDEFSKWLNRCMLGNFDFRESKYPPYYLPTPKCMLLSDQDYYLAIRKGRCLLESEKTNAPVEFVYVEGEKYPKAVYEYSPILTLNLPDFNRDKSVFEGKITIKSLTNPNQTPVEITISRGLRWLEISPVTTSSFFTPRTDNAVGKGEIYDFDNTKAEPAKEESLWNQLMAVSHNQPMPTTTENTQSDKNDESEAPKIGLYLIKWSLGKIKGKHDVTVRVNYWPEGKQDESADQSQSDDSSSDPNTPKPVKERTPYLLSYHYIKD